MSNVPDDWGAYGGTCSECGHYWHKSGTYECKCVETFKCERHYSWGACGAEVDDEDKLTKTFDGEHWCQDCVDDAFKCEECGDIFPWEDSDGERMYAPEFNPDSDGHTCIYCAEEKQQAISHREATVVLVEETEETTSERIIRAQIEGGINANH